jgi:hypothetical protein
MIDENLILTTVFMVIVCFVFFKGELLLRDIGFIILWQTLTPVQPVLVDMFLFGFIYFLTWCTYIGVKDLMRLLKYYV